MYLQGDLNEMRKAVEAIEAAGLEAAEARDKLTRVLAVLKKVSALPQFSRKENFEATVN